MAHTTKRTLSETLKKILQEKSLDKVTVVDIVEASAINRQTFYYHFKDIYDLVEWTFLTDNTQSLSGKRSYATWQQGYLQIFDYVRENKSFIKHVYYSEGREILTRFLYDITYKLLLGVIDERAEGLWWMKRTRHLLHIFTNSSLPKYISNFPYFTDIPAHSLVK